MTRLAHLARIALAVAAFSGLMASSAAAQQQSQFTTIASLAAGWTDDTMSINLAPIAPSTSPPPLTNPDNCPVTNAGYATNPADPGHGLFHSLLLSALLNNRQVSLLVSGCIYGKPRVISVAIL